MPSRRALTLLFPLAALLFALSVHADLLSFFSPKTPPPPAAVSPLKALFAQLFPFDSPAYNSLLATFYISSVPNFILLALPEAIEPASLNTMIAFATGGLLGDVFMHLVPHAFFGECAGEEGRRVLRVDEKGNIIIGGSIFLGFMAFFVLDKTMRVLNADPDGDASHGHSHGHGHSHSHPAVKEKPSSSSSSAKSSATHDPAHTGELRSRKSPSDLASTPASAPPAEKGPKEGINPSLRLSAYLSMFGDFTHNITDGLAMAASFYSSPALGAVTTLATFAHEIPHEIADYSILIKSGFTKRQAFSSQLVTAVGAFIGTFLGIWIAETSGAGAHIKTQMGEGVLGTSVGKGDLVIPMTAGGFLYIASVSVVPELLAESRSAVQMFKEYGAMAFGFVCMGVIAWSE